MSHFGAKSVRGKPKGCILRQTLASGTGSRAEEDEVRGRVQAFVLHLTPQRFRLIVCSCHIDFACTSLSFSFSILTPLPAPSTLLRLLPLTLASPPMHPPSVHPLHLRERPLTVFCLICFFMVHMNMGLRRVHLWTANALPFSPTWRHDVEKCPFHVR